MPVSKSDTGTSEGLKVPKRQKPRGRLWLKDGSCVRLGGELLVFYLLLEKHEELQFIPSHGNSGVDHLRHRHAPLRLLHHGYNLAPQKIASSSCKISFPILP